MGNNGAFKAGPGWNPCTGLGSPDGAKILSLLGGSGKHATAASATGASQGAVIPGVAPVAGS